MKSKDLLKKILPVAAGLVVIALVAILISVFTKDKANPSLSKEYASQTYFTYEDGKITFKNNEAYEKAKSSYGVSVLTDLIDKQLLTTENEAVKAEDVEAKYVSTLFSSDTIAEYLEDNDIAEDEAEEKLQKVIDTFVTNSFASYGVKVADDEIKLVKSGEEYKLEIKTGTDFYKYMQFQVAKYNYAYAKLEAQYAEEIEAYKEYKVKYAEYEKYLEDLADYKAGDLADEPKEVSQPTAPSITVAESKFQEKWDEENVDAYWAVVIPYTSESEATRALLQHEIVVKSLSVKIDGTTTTKSFWFHYGREVLGEGETSAFEEDDKDGYNVITKSDFYKDLAQYYIDNSNTNKTEDTYGAYVLSDDEIKQTIIDLYNQYYGTNKITATPDAAAEKALGEDSKFYYTAAELTSMSLLTSVSGNKFNEFDETETDFRKFYNEGVSSSYPKVYWILAKEDKVQWDDDSMTDEIKNNYMYAETDEAKAMRKEFLEAALTSTVINNKLDELRVEKGLIIYDTDLEADYKETYSSTSYKETKKSNKTIVAKCGSFEVSADDLLKAISAKYAVAIALEQYQYEWMFLYAAKADGTLFNKYIDYEKYLNGTSLKKSIKNNDDAKDLYDEIAGKEGTITNIKNNLASGGYADYGYEADYSWNKFIKEFFGQYYGVQINSNDDLGVYLIYQQIVEDYQAYISDVSKVDWTLVQANYVNTVNSYINATGFHLLIMVTDEDGNTVDPTATEDGWTQAQKDAATELYAKVMELVKAVDEEDISDVLSAVATAFEDIDKYPVAMADGTYNKAANIQNAKGTKKFNYTYTYNDGVKTYTDYELELAQYKSLGLSVKYEDSLNTTTGAMVAPFEEAVREMWNKHIEDMLAEDADGVYEDIEIHSAAIETEFGYHLYVNQSYDLSTYISDDKYVNLPTQAQVALYQYESKQASEDDYVSIATLVADYVAAKQNDKADDLAKAKQNVVNVLEKIEFLKGKYTVDTVATFIEADLYDFTNFAKLTEKATSSSKKIDVDDLTNNTLVQTKISTWYTAINTEYTGNYYYQLAVLQATVPNAAKFNVAGAQDGAVADLLNIYVTSYQGYLTYNKGNKDRCSAMLTSLAYTGDLAKVFSETDYTAIKELAQTLYLGLDAKDQEELKEDYNKVFGAK